ncbi:C4b-binding protein alpha chain-like isoform X2 [Acipenser ruthenus]|uniref:C4b-binding protein alpha chain-like isoform X2 n=1 Tax=Acipenser ruthenus TaxID=7906 RepID=UPI002740B1FE|nr:C4b-binding protein alpha chain-like isoform X2 [Acipenser ruthenus]
MSVCKIINKAVFLVYYLFIASVWAKSCGSPGEVLNGHFVFEGVYFGDKASVVCDEGYLVAGRDYRVCLDKGWDGQIPVCEVVKCPDPPEIADGEIRNQRSGDVEYNTVVVYQCTKGFLIGSRELVCTLHGNYSSSPPQCKEISCQNPTLPNGRKTAGFGPDYKYKDDVSFACSEGFELLGENAVTCEENSEWHPKIPTCIPLKRTCDAPPPTKKIATLQPGYIAKSEYQPGDRVYYNCKHGFRKDLSKRDYIVCKKDLTWTSLKLRCTPKSCGSPGEVLNGHFVFEGVHFGDKASVVCDEGYLVAGRDYRVCLDKGWDGQIPVCEVVKCPDPPEIADGEIRNQRSGDVEYNTVVVYQCTKGFLIGSRELVCTLHGNYSSSPPQCKEISCQNPTLPNGRKTAGFGPDYKYKDDVSFACSEGFELLGENAVTCEENSEWHPKIPTCIPLKRTCDAPPPPTKKIATLQPGYIAKSEYQPGDRVYYNCKHGFRKDLSKRDYIVCKKDLTWTSLKLRCTRVSCKIPAQIRNSIIGKIRENVGDLTVPCESIQPP